MNDEIRLTFERKATPYERYHVCAADGVNWTSMFSCTNIERARAWAGRKQSRDPQRDVRLLDRKEGCEVPF